jgi:hypothetical protein
MYNIKIIHLIHADGPGGVETGAKLGQQDFKDDISYEIKFIYNTGDNIIVKFIKFLKTTKLLFKRLKSEDNYIILSSLWMSHIISFILKILLKNMTWISFIHNSNYTNIISNLICTKLTRLADKQVFDSFSTAKAYNYKSINRNRIINYFFQKYNLKKFDIKNWSNRRYDFITVARNTKQKGFLEIENFCKNMSNLYSSRLKILIITDNIKKIINLEELKKKLNLICDIQFEVNLTNTDVLKCMTDSKIYFCLSHYEGFGITIVESLLSGCFIVTTNVGEQEYYLHPNRRLVLNNSSNYNLDFNYINQNAPSKENFDEAKEFLHKNVKSYSDSLKHIVMENK